MSPDNDLTRARELFATLAARDGPQISVAGHSRFFATASRTPLGVVLLHGLTNAPEQWVRFAGELAVRGANVVVPRFPGHGYVDTATHAIARVRARDLLRVTAQAIDVAAAAADRVVVVGLSVGGPIAAARALEDARISRVVCVSPFFGIAHLGRRANAGLTAVLEWLPNAFLPWDPRGGTSQTPPYAYRRFPTRVLAECLRIALDVQRRARHGASPSGDARFLLNAREPACNNALAEATSRMWNRSRAGTSVVDTANDFPPIHDVIDPHDPQNRVDVVYPRLHALVGV